MAYKTLKGEKLDPFYSVPLPIPSLRKMEQVMDFAERVVKAGNLFPRHPARRDEVIRWNYTGKLAEVCFAEWIRQHDGIIQPADLKNVSRPDHGDFFTVHGESVDVKTASRSFHQCINIPAAMCTSRNLHDYYIGIRLQFVQITRNLTDFYTIETAKICGFALRSDVELLPIRSSSLGDCKQVPLYSLRNIVLLLDNFKEKRAAVQNPLAIFSQV